MLLQVLLKMNEINQTKVAFQQHQKLNFLSTLICTYNNLFKKIKVLYCSQQFVNFYQTKSR